MASAAVNESRNLKHFTSPSLVSVYYSDDALFVIPWAVEAFLSSACTSQIIIAFSFMGTHGTIDAKYVQTKCKYVT